MIHKIELEGKEVSLKKDKTGIRIVYPIKKDLTKSIYIKEEKKWNINFKNLLLGGSWFNLFKVIILVSIILFIAFSYKHDMANCIQYGQDLMRINMTNYIN